MALFTASQTVDMRSLPDPSDVSATRSNTPTGFSITSGAYKVTVIGTGFVYAPAGDAKGGTFNSVEISLNGASIFKASELNTSSNSVYDNGVLFAGNRLTGLLAEASLWFNGNDVVQGSAGNDVLTGFAGNDAIDGGAGRDTALFFGNRANFLITSVNGTITVQDKTGVQGTDTLTSIERLQFDDTTLAFDNNGSSGQAYRLYQAAFNRTPDTGGLGFQVSALDKGAGLAGVAGNFIASPEFARTYGNLDNTQFVTQLYQNVLHRGPDAGGLAFHVGNLSSGFNARADVLVGFSESPENQAALVGVITAGIVYTTF